MQKITLSVAALLLFFATACQTQQEVLSPEKTEAETNNQIVALDSVYRKTVETHYLDGVLNEEQDFDAMDYHSIMIMDKIVDGEVVYYSTHAFTNQEDLYAWTEERDIPLREHHSLIEDLRGYAESSGAIEEYEKTGVMPQYYLDYMNERTNKSQTVAGKVKVLGLGTIYQDGNCVQDDARSAGFFKLNPSVSNRMNNTTSSFRTISIGLTSLFDRTFFRQQMIPTVLSLPLECINLNGNRLVANDRTSSLVSN